MGTQLLKCSLPLILVVVQSCIATKCNCEGFFCVTDKEYQLCANGELLGDPIPCKTGAVCRNDTENECNTRLLCEDNKTHDQTSSSGDFTTDRLYTDGTESTATTEYITKETTQYTIFDDSITNKTSTNVTSVGPSERTTESIIVSSPNKTNDGFSCSDIGLYPDPKDCRKYYACGDQEHPMHILCPENTYYNEEYTFCTEDMPERCAGAGNRPASTTPNETTQTTEGLPSTSTLKDDNGNEFHVMCPDEGYFPHPENCHIYYICSGAGEGISASCPVNTYYNDETTLCTEELPERCRISDEHTTNTTQENSYTTILSTEKTEITTEVTRESQNSGFVCPGEGNFADTENCRNYYICYTSGVAYITLSITCPENTYYDDTSEVCTVKMPERCMNSTTPSSPEYSLPPILPRPDDEFTCLTEGYHPHPQDCHRYYLCYEGEAIPITCPDSGFFNEETEFCIPEMPERCRNVPTTSEPTIPKEETQFKCPGEGYYPDPENCQLYYICLGGADAIPVSCPENTFYDELNSFCNEKMPQRCRGTDQPSDEKTTVRNDFETTVPTVTPGEVVCTQDGHFPNPENCHDYYVCYNGVPAIPVSCPNGLFFDERNNFCTNDIPERCRKNENDNNQWMTPTTTPPPGKDEFKCPREGYYPDPENCQRYFLCYDLEHPVPISCPNKTYFDEKDNFCTSEIPKRCIPEKTEQQPPQTKLPEDDGKFSCPSAGRFAYPKNCDGYWVCLNENFGYSVKCPKGTYFNKNTEFCEKDMPPGCKHQDNTHKNLTCPENGYFPDPTDCHSYYMCFWGRSIKIRCPAYTYYDEKAKRCSFNIPIRCRKEEKFVCPGVGFFPNPRDCRKYYMCDLLGNSFPANCPGGKYFNEKTRGCSKEIPRRCLPTSADKFVCRSSGYFADPVNCSMFHVCSSSGDKYTGICNPNTYYHANSRTCLAGLPARCTGQMTEGHKRNTKDVSDKTNESNIIFVCPSYGLFPDPKSCHNFYDCLGMVRKLTCKDGLYFNDETQKCEEEMPLRCRGNTETGPSSTRRFEGYTCPGHGLFRDPENCQRFYYCNWHLEAYLQKCKGSAYFNDVTKRCEADIPARCRFVDGRLKSLANPPSGVVCPKRGNFPDLEDCHNYYFCTEEGSQPILYTCPESQYFSKDKGKCHKIKHGNECIDKIPPSTEEDESSEETIEEFVCTRPGLFPDFSNCSICTGKGLSEHKHICQYRRKREGGDLRNSTLQHLPVMGFAEILNVTDTKNATCVPGYHPDPVDCKKYFLCSPTFIKYNYTCPGKLYFNEKIGLCSSKLSEKCMIQLGSTLAPTTENPTTDGSTETTTMGPTTTDPSTLAPTTIDSITSVSPVAASSSSVSSTTKVSTTKAYSTKGPTAKPSTTKASTTVTSITTPNPSVIVCKSPGPFPDPKDSKKYYKCSLTLQLYHFSCPGKLKFNSISQKCSSQIPVV